MTREEANGQHRCRHVSLGGMWVLQLFLSACCLCMKQVILSISFRFSTMTSFLVTEVSGGGGCIPLYEMSLSIVIF